MDLKEFIKETISAIVDASSDLQEKYAADDVVINPPSDGSGKDVFVSDESAYIFRRVKNISFDVAVTAASKTTGGGEGGIKVFSVGVGAKGEKSASSEKVSRVQFEIPITLKPSNHEGANMERGAEELRRSRDAMYTQTRSSGWQAS